jgi:hypothetical protein
MTAAPDVVAASQFKTAFGITDASNRRFLRFDQQVLLGERLVGNCCCFGVPNRPIALSRF